MKTFKALELDQEQQLALRLYNFEQTYGAQAVVKNLMMILAADKYIVYDAEFAGFDRHSATEMLYLQSVQIVRYFGKELVTRMLTFSYAKEMEEVRNAA